MELPGTIYLYTLAALAMTFIGFSVIVMILRQTLGDKLTRFDALLARVFMEFGLMISASALLPPLLTMWELPAPMVWRISNGLAALPPIVYALTYPARRRAVSGQPTTPFYVRLNISGVLLIGLSLLANATGMLGSLTGAAFSTVLTIFLVFAIGSFLQAMTVMLGQPRKKSIST